MGYPTPVYHRYLYCKMSLSCKSTNLAAHDKDSSTSDSSEDEEEAQRIKAAICDDSLFNSFLKNKDGINNQKQQLHEISSPDLKQSNKVSNHKNLPPSRRLKDQTEEECDEMGPTTTPEFRAHVAKILSQLLERQLDGDCLDVVWAEPSLKKGKVKGIKLLCDSEALITGLDSTVTKPSTSTQLKKSKSSKHRLSTSSESSDDDRISACVFSVNDIQRENNLLLQSSEQQTDPDSSLSSNRKKVKTSDDEISTPSE